MLNAQKCAYCGSPIEAQQRWVREKVYQPACDGHDPIYRRYHVDLFPGHGLSCWEKHELEAEIDRLIASAA
jgi:hypothetical protein